MTTAVVTSVSQVAVPARVTMASCAAPAKTMLVLHAMLVGIADSVIATPSTSANGTVGRYRGNTSRIARLATPSSTGSVVFATIGAGYADGVELPRSILVQRVP